MNPQPKELPTGNFSWYNKAGLGFSNMPIAAALSEAKYQPGDIVGVTEPWKSVASLDALSGSELVSQGHGNRVIHYLADGDGSNRVGPWGRFRQERFLPDAFVRTKVRITSVEVQRVQEISEEDAIAEGVEALDAEREEQDFKVCPRCGGTRLHTGIGDNMGVIFDVDCTECDTHKKRFMHLWDSIHAKDAPWEKNPWVWVYRFQLEDPSA